MKRVTPADPSVAGPAIAKLFDEWPPVLVVVKFSGATPDWYLFDDLAQLRDLLGKLGKAVELQVSSVWDLVDAKGAVAVMAGPLAQQMELDTK